MSTAAQFLADLAEHRDPAEREKLVRHFTTGRDAFLGVRMGTVFALAQRHVDMPLAEIEALLESPVHEARAGAVKIMAKRAARRDGDGAALYDLYLRRHDRIDNWDLVDLGAWDVVGRHLADRPRDVLDRLAASGVVWERRTAVLATLHFLRRGEVDDAFRLCGLLHADPHHLVQKAVGGILREAGKHDPDRLRAFLDAHAAAMPRVALRYAVEKLHPDERRHYRSLR